MTQQIDPARLRAAAEHLEWVLNQYPGSDDVQSLLRALRPLLEDAKAGQITQPVERNDVPGAYNFGNGRYSPYKQPSVDDAFVAFRVELRGGLSEQERRIIAKYDAMRAGSEGNRP
jgi:hypothetical protein